MSAFIALGTAQFGFDYGVQGAGQVPPGEVSRILAAAHAAGIDTLDTAIAYGESEACLGRCDLKGWQVITKLPVLPAGVTDAGQWVREQVRGSLARLGQPCLHGLLLHRPGDLLGRQGPAIDAALQRLKQEGLVARIGVSIYAPAELDPLVERFALDLVQAPVNPLDRRLITSGWLERLADMGIRLHARSAFLQGLLLMSAAQRPAYFRRWQPLWQRWESWLAASGQSPLQASLGFALGCPGVERVVVGVHGVAQLREILAATALPSKPPPKALVCDDLDLIHPGRWRLGVSSDGVAR